MAIMTKLTGKALAVVFGSAVAVGATGMLVKNDEGQPIISSLLSKGGDTPTMSSGKPAEPGAKPEGDGEEVASLPETKADAPVVAPGVSDPVLPSFDVLRVEKDGSVVVAGQATPDSAVEILSNGEVLAKGQSGATGEFAIVFDTPLPAGNHELLIRSTPKEGEPVVSAEAGIVTVPQAGEGEVMVMVQKEGEASRILQVPQSIEAAPVEEPSKEVAALDQPKSEAPATAEAEPNPEPKPAEPAEAETKPAEVVQAEPKAAEAAPEKPAIADLSKPVLVQAVDVESDKVFIAGTGEADNFVRVYINDELKGTTKVTPAGTFLFELNEGLAPGKHDLRVDQIGDNESQVISRAAVVIDHSPEPVAVAEAAPVVEPKPEAPAAESAPSVQAEEKPAEPAGAESTETVESKPAQAEAKAEIAASAETAAGAKPVIETGRSVIIRRGDNLWKISRRMLGEGRKYTMIYSANDDQIKDPNRIYPGQVFDVPEDEQPVTAGGTKTSG